MAPKRLRVKLTFSAGLNISPRTFPRQFRSSHLGSTSPPTATPEPPKFKSPGLMASNSNHKVRRRQCHCKQSRCVKLYCECFASGAYCDGCSCIDCRNNAQNEDTRMAAAEIILERKPNAFTPKIGGNPCAAQLDGEAAKDVEEIAKHNRGCQCKKTGCLKKYCECFQGNIPCSENCKCSGCKNFGDCEERMAVFGGACHDSKTYIQQAEATISSDSTDHNYFQKHRRKFQEFLNIDMKDSTVMKLKQDQVNLAPLTTFDCESIDPALGIVTSTVPGPSKFAYRSLMADVIRPADTRGLCSFLVVASETAKSLTEKNAAGKTQKAKENLTTNALEAQDRSTWEETQHVQKMEPESKLTGNQNNGIGTDGFRSDGSDTQERTFFSTERDDLMYYEDIPFTESAFSQLKNTLLNFLEIKETSRKHTDTVCAGQDMETHKKVLDCNITVRDNCLSEDYADTIESEYPRSNGTDEPEEEEQPFPTEIDELMCDTDKSFIKAAFSYQNLRKDYSNVYIEQERHVLTCFREFLWQLIIFGTEKEKSLVISKNSVRNSA